MEKLLLRDLSIYHLIDAQWMAAFKNIKNNSKEWNQLYIKLNPRDKMCMSR